MEKIKLLLAFVVSGLITSSPCYAQEWAITYGGSDYDSVRSIQEISDGGYIAAGSSGGDAWIFKLNSDGTLDGPSAWQKSYGSGSVGSVQETSDGGYIAAGSSGGDAWIFKLNSDGSVDWQKTYSGSSGFPGDSFRQTFDEGGNPDGYIMASTTTSFGAGHEDFLVLRFDLDGNIVWQKTYGGGDWNLAKSIQQTQDGGYVVTGWTGAWTQGVGWQVWVLKLYPDGQPNPEDYGVIEWQKSYTRFVGNYDWVECIQQTSDGGYVMTGATWSGEYALFVLKIDSNGTVEWNKKYAWSAEAEWGRSIRQTFDEWGDPDGYIVAGTTESFGAGGSDFWILKLDENGEIPGCSRMSSSSAIVSDTSIEGQNTSVTPQDFSAQPVDTDVIPQDTEAETTRVCGAGALIADFSANPTSGVTPLEVTFTDGSVGNIDTWEWDFDNNGTIDSYDQSPAPWTYTEAGDYTVTLTLTGSGGSNTETKVDYIHVTTNSPPNVPVNPSPSDSAGGVGLLWPVLSWTGGDPDPEDTVTYDVYFGRFDPPNLKSSGLADTTYTLGKLNCFTTYYWRVVARDNNGAETPGPLWSFTTTDVGCPVIETLSPNPCNPLDVVTITGRNFGDTKQAIRWGKSKYKKKRVVSWTNTRIEFKVKAHNSWPSGKTKAKDLWLKVGPAGSKVKSNRVPLTITKP